MYKQLSPWTEFWAGILIAIFLFLISDIFPDIGYFILLGYLFIVIPLIWGGLIRLNKSN